MATYLVQTYASADGDIWQALDAAETVTIDADPADWFDAAEVASESGAVPGSWTRVLVWSGDTEDLNEDTAIYRGEHQVPNVPPVQRHEIEAWLGDHDLADDQVDELVRAAAEIARRYPDPDDADDREAALTVAHRLMVEDPDTVVRNLAAELQRARLAEARAVAGLQQGAVALVEDGGKGQRGIRTQQGYAERAGVTRMTVREWLGLR